MAWQWPPVVGSSDAQSSDRGCAIDAGQQRDVDMPVARKQ